MDRSGSSRLTLSSEGAGEDLIDISWPARMAEHWGRARAAAALRSLGKVLYREMP